MRFTEWHWQTGMVNEAGKDFFNLHFTDQRCCEQDFPIVKFMLRFSSITDMFLPLADNRQSIRLIKSS